MAGIDFYYWPTPNGWKVSILLEELGVPYTVRMLDIGAGNQFADDFTKISPNQRMPAIVDHDVVGAPVPVFESAAVMIYLADKYERFRPETPLGRKEMLEWMFWQVGNQGPMGGQHSHFFNYAPDSEKDGYAAKRYRGEYERCIAVLERRLEGRAYILDDYSIVDMICWPWMLITKAMNVPLDPYPNVTRWRQLVKERPAVQRGVALSKAAQKTGPIDDVSRKNLFGSSGQ